MTQLDAERFANWDQQPHCLAQLVPCGYAALAGAEIDHNQINVHDLRLRHCRTGRFSGWRPSAALRIAVASAATPAFE
jgi:hypothetical protein